MEKERTCIYVGFYDWRLAGPYYCPHACETYGWLGADVLCRCEVGKCPMKDPEKKVFREEIAKRGLDIKKMWKPKKYWTERRKEND